MYIPKFYHTKDAHTIACDNLTEQDAVRRTGGIHTTRHILTSHTCIQCFPQKGNSSPLLPCHTAQDSSKSIALSPGSPSSVHRRGVQRSYVNLCTEEGEPGDKASKSMCQGFNCKLYSSLHLTIPTLINSPCSVPVSSHLRHTDPDAGGRARSLW